MTVSQLRLVLETDDLDAALAEGSTLVRIGSALYGPRD